MRHTEIAKHLLKVNHGGIVVRPFHGDYEIYKNGYLIINYPVRDFHRIIAGYIRWEGAKDINDALERIVSMALRSINRSIRGRL